MTDPTKEPWHLDKRVPIATLVVLIVQFTLGVAWITTLSNSVGVHNSDIAAIRSDASAREGRLRAVELMQATQSSDLRSIQSGISRIEAQLEKLQPKP